jgi:hypothetical protein
VTIDAVSVGLERVKRSEITESEARNGKRGRKGKDGAIWPVFSFLAQTIGGI